MPCVSLVSAMNGIRDKRRLASTNGPFGECCARLSSLGPYSVDWGTRCPCQARAAAPRYGEVAMNPCRSRRALAPHRVHVSRCVVGLLPAAVVAVAVLAVAVVAGSSAGASVPAWRVSRTFAPPFDTAIDSACPTAAVCFVLTKSSRGGSQSAIAVSKNDGKSWTLAPMPMAFAATSSDSSTQVLDELACPSAKTCLVLGHSTSTLLPELAKTTNAGRSWRLSALPSAFAVSGPSASPPALACLSVSTCLAATAGPAGNSGVVLRTTNGGGRWHPVKTTTFGLVWASCASSRACAVLGGGHLLSTVNGGDKWVTHAMPAHSSAVDEVACPSATTCLAAGATTNVVWRSSDRGASWKSAALTHTPGVQRLSCGTTKMCEAVSAVGLVSTGPTLWRTANAGKTWTRQRVPNVSSGFAKAYAPSVALDTVVCRSVRDCLIAGHAQARRISFYVFGFVARTVNGGKSWTQRPLPATLGQLAAISCASTSHCEAVGANPTGAFVGTAKSGSSWVLQQETVPEVGGTYAAVACASTKLCIAVGSIDTGPTSGVGAIARTTDGGAKWKTKSVPAAFLLSGVSCPSTKVCVAVGFASSESSAILLKTQDGGASWAVQKLPADVGRLTDVACASTVRCESVGDDSGAAPAIVSTGNGKRWVRQSVPRALGVGTFLVAVDCPTAKVCQAAGGAFTGSAVLLGTHNGGAKWSMEKVPAGVGQLQDVACPSANICQASGSAASGPRGAIVRTAHGGSHWAAQHLPATAGALSGIGCPSTSVCYAAGQTVGGAGLLLRAGR